MFLHPLLFWERYGCRVWFIFNALAYIVASFVCGSKCRRRFKCWNRIKVPVKVFHKLYFWTIQYECISRFCLHAQLPEVEKLLEWCKSRAKYHVNGIPAPEIMVRASEGSLWMAIAGACSSAAVLLVYQVVGEDWVRVTSKDVLAGVLHALLLLNGGALVWSVVVGVNLEVACVKWVITTALHALSPIELAFRVATGIRLHTFQEALEGKEPSRTGEWGDLKGSGQDDGTSRYLRQFSEGGSPLKGVEALYPGDLPIRIFATGVVMVVAATGIYYQQWTYNARQRTFDANTLVVAFVVLHLGAYVMVLRYLLNLRLAAIKIERAVEVAYKAAAIAYWEPRWPEATPLNLEALGPHSTLGEVEAKSRNPSVEAELCGLTSKKLTFEEFGNNHFPSWLEVLCWPIHDTTRFKNDSQNMVVGFECDPNKILKDVLACIGSSLHSVPKLSIQSDCEKWVNDRKKDSELVIGGMNCGERKLLISKKGEYISGEVRNHLKEAISRDLLALAADGYDKAMIPPIVSAEWWLAQPDFDSFVGTVSKYRILGRTNSGARGIKASINENTYQRLTGVKHLRRYEDWVCEMLGELEDSRTAESITHGAGLSSEQTERLLLPAGVTSCGVEILREGLQDMVLEGANETRELSSVVLYEMQDRTGSSMQELSLKSSLEAGMHFAAYYPLEDDALSLREWVRSKLAACLPDSSHYVLEYASSASTVIYVHIVKKTSIATLEDINEALLRAMADPPKVTIAVDSETLYPDVFEIRRAGDHLELVQIPQCPIIDRVLYVRLSRDERVVPLEYLVIHGMNIFCQTELKLKWRIGEGGPLNVLSPVHDATLRKYNVQFLTAKPESVAVVVPVLDGSDDGILYLECWRNELQSIGNHVAIDLSTFGRFRRFDWQYDVFISHAGTNKDLARELVDDLKSLGFIAFVDMNALHPGDKADAKMIEAVQRAPIGLVLVDRAFLHRKWTVAELKLIVKADTLLPVLINMTYEEFKKEWFASEMTSALGNHFFQEVLRTTFEVHEAGSLRVLRQRICLAVTRMFVERVCPNLPDKRWSARHIQCALEAANRIQRDVLRDLTARECEHVGAWIKKLKDMLS